MSPKAMWAGTGRFADQPRRDEKARPGPWEKGAGPSPDCKAPFKATGTRGLYLRLSILAFCCSYCSLVMAPAS